MGGMLLGGMMADSQNDAYQESVFTFYRPNQRETDDSLSLFTADTMMEMMEVIWEVTMEEEESRRNTTSSFQSIQNHNFIFSFPSLVL